MQNFNLLKSALLVEFNLQHHVAIQPISVQCTSVLVCCCIFYFKNFLISFFDILLPNNSIQIYWVDALSKKKKMKIFQNNLHFKKWFFHILNGNCVTFNISSWLFFVCFFFCIFSLLATQHRCNRFVLSMEFSQIPLMIHIWMVIKINCKLQRRFCDFLKRSKAIQKYLSSENEMW